MGVRIAEVHPEPITKSLSDMPIVALDNVRTHPLIRPDHVAPVFRVVYDLFREFSQPTLKHRSLFCCLSSREQIPERLTALLALKHPDVPLLAPHLLMKALQEVRRPDEPPERLGKRDRQVG